jgi:hypothetical protein
LFLFDKSQNDKRLLLNKLERIGLELAEERQDYRCRVWVLQCSWLSEKPMLLWQQRWVSDGVDLEDIGTKLFMGEKVLDEFLFEILRTDSENIPLRKLIIQRIVESFGKVTGKRP